MPAIEIGVGSLSLSGHKPHIGPQDIEIGAGTLALSGAAPTDLVTEINPGTIDVFTETVDCSFAGGDGWALDPPDASFTGRTAQAASFDIELTSPAATFTGVVPVTGSFSITLPALDASFSWVGISVELDAPTVSFTGHTNLHGTLRTSIDPPDLSFSGRTGTNDSFAFVVPAPDVSFTGTTTQTASFDLTIPVSASFTGQTGRALELDAELPALDASFTGAVRVSGTISVELSNVEASFSQGTQTTTVVTTLVLNVENMALSSYSGYSFESYAYFNGVYLGANSSGIFSLTGNTDDGTAIVARARTGKTDMGDTHYKRVDRAYVGYTTEGTLQVKASADDGEDYEYDLMPTGKTGIHNTRAMVGRGLKGRYFQFEVTNNDGSYFEVDSLEVHPLVLTRRVG